MLNVLEMELRLIRQIGRGKRRSLAAAAQERETVLLEEIRQQRMRSSPARLRSERHESGLPRWAGFAEVLFQDGSIIKRVTFVQARDSGAAGRCIVTIAQTLYPEAQRWLVTHLCSEASDPMFVLGHRVDSGNGYSVMAENPIVAEREPHSPVEWMESQGIPLLSMSSHEEFERESVHRATASADDDH